MEGKMNLFDLLEPKCTKSYIDNEIAELKSDIQYKFDGVRFYKTDEEGKYKTGDDTESIYMKEAIRAILEYLNIELKHTVINEFPYIKIIAENK